MAMGLEVGENRNVREISRITLRLQFHEFSIPAFHPHERGVVSFLDDSPALENQNFVRISYCRETMRDDQDGHPPAEIPHSLLDETLEPAVERTRRFVQDQYPGGTNQSSRKGQTLFLPAG